MAKSQIRKFEDDYEFLSNFFDEDASVTDDTFDLIYSSNEHAYQAAKTLDYAIRKEISKLRTPNEAKKYGNNKAKMKLRPDWEEVKYQIMYDLCYQKFSTHKKLKKLLLETGDSILVEGNWWHDVCYGVCTCKVHRGTGENWLGRILMMVRDRIIMEIEIKQKYKALAKRAKELRVTSMINVFSP